MFFNVSKNGVLTCVLLYFQAAEGYLGFNIIDKSDRLLESKFELCGHFDGVRGVDFCSDGRMVCIYKQKCCLVYLI